MTSYAQSAKTRRLWEVTSEVRHVTYRVARSGQVVRVSRGPSAPDATQGAATAGPGSEAAYRAHSRRWSPATTLGTLLTSGVGGELLPQGEVLQGNRPAASEGGTQRPDEQDDQEPNHQPILARQKIANDSSVARFSRSTGSSCLRAGGFL